LGHLPRVPYLPAPSEERILGASPGSPYPSAQSHGPHSGPTTVVPSGIPSRRSAARSPIQGVLRQEFPAAGHFRRHLGDLRGIPCWKTQDGGLHTEVPCPGSLPLVSWRCSASGGSRGCELAVIPWWCPLAGILKGALRQCSPAVVSLAVVRWRGQLSGFRSSFPSLGFLSGTCTKSPVGGSVGGPILGVCLRSWLSVGPCRGSVIWIPHRSSLVGVPASSFWRLGNTSWLPRRNCNGFPPSVFFLLSSRDGHLSGVPCALKISRIPPWGPLLVFPFRESPSGIELPVGNHRDRTPGWKSTETLGREHGGK
jgi:hypothetical protein